MGWKGLNNSSATGRTSIGLPTTISRPRRIVPLFSNGIFYGDAERLEKWQYITMAGVPGVYQIVSDIISEPIDPNDPDGPTVHKVQIDPKAAGAAGPGAVLTFANAVFKTFGPITP